MCVCNYIYTHTYIISRNNKRSNKSCTRSLGRELKILLKYFRENEDDPMFLDRGT